VEDDAGCASVVDRMGNGLLVEECLGLDQHATVEELGLWGVNFKCSC
jgi:hypothetical protein